MPCCLPVSALKDGKFHKETLFCLRCQEKLLPELRLPFSPLGESFLLVWKSLKSPQFVKRKPRDALQSVQLDLMSHFRSKPSQNRLFWALNPIMTRVNPIMTNARDLMFLRAFRPRHIDTTTRRDYFRLAAGVLPLTFASVFLVWHVPARPPST